MAKTALIVDDSKSARVVLKRMLETHHLDVDTVESAEDALLYLNGNRPDVIFMDHMMPGMDGFEAISAIKNNPDTATIPIMMYTSQEGELYVGQARALGAVGVLPKQVEPVEVSKILKSLRVIGSETERVKQRVPDTADTGAIHPDLERLDQDIKTLIQDLFDQQRAVLRRDMLDSYETIATRVADEIREPVTGDIESNPARFERQVPPRLQIAVGILAVIGMVFAWLFIQREQSFADLRQGNADLQRALAEQQAIETNGTLLLRRLEAEHNLSIDHEHSLILRALEWGANQSSRYAFGDLPLGDSRLVLFEELSDQLMRMRFSGVVRIESHVGDFCMVDTGTDGYRLAEPRLPAQQCDLLGFAQGEAYELGLRQSVAFANFVAKVSNESAGRIRYEFVSLGGTAPLLDYPLANAEISAGAWNEIASSNNRVAVALIPDGR